MQFVLDYLTEFDDFRELDPQALVEKRQEYQTSLEATANELDKIVQLANNCTEDLSQCQTYVSTVDLLPLPKIGGELMNLKQLEENLNALREEMERVKTTANNAIQGKLQGVETAGNIQFGNTITSTNRMHVDGVELLVLLNKAGVVVSKSWGGNGNLSVEGEIRGKLWFSDEFTLDVPNNGTVVALPMLPANKCLAFITRVQGAFAGGGECVWVEVRGDGLWYLCGQALQDGVRVSARCAGTP